MLGGGRRRSPGAGQVEFVWGKRNSYLNAVLWATIWAEILESGMTGPPMARMMGLFGYNYAWPQLFLKVALDVGGQARNPIRRAVLCTL